MAREESLIAAYLLDGKGGGAKMTWEGIANWTPEQGTLWVHLNYKAQRTKQWLNRRSGLDKITARALISEESRPRSVIMPKGIMLFLRGVNLNPGHDPEDMVSIRVWVSQHLIITTRKRQLLSISDIRSALEQSHGPKTPAEFIRVLNDRLIDRMSDVLDSIDTKVDELEEQMLTAESYQLRPKIADIRRQSIMIRRYLAPQREALNRLYAEDTDLLSHIDKLYVRESTDRIIRYIEDLDSARERASITQEELMSRLSSQIERRMYILSVVAVIFLPLTFITGLLGINVGGIPGAQYKWAFLLVCVMLFALLFLMLWVFHRKKWI